MINCKLFDNILLVTLNLDVMSLLAQALIFMASTDLGYRIFKVANKKFINVFVKAFRKSDASGHHIAKFSSRLENCHATTDRFCLSFCDIINYNDVTSTTNPYVFVENILSADV